MSIDMSWPELRPSVCDKGMYSHFAWGAPKMNPLHSYRYTEAAQSLHVGKVIQTTVLGSQIYFPVTGKKI